MEKHTNPFHDLYLTEAIGPDLFVQLFSPIFMDQGTALYQPGNVVLKGLQGSGKTMLLNLLKPEVRMAYQRKKVDFPVPKIYRNYISAGINLRKSGIAEFAQLLLPDSSFQVLREHSLLFGDFVNYWVVHDLITSIELILREGDAGLSDEIGIKLDVKLLDHYCRELSISDCWLNGLERADNAKSFKNQLRKRINIYRSYINLNIDELPSNLRKSKSVVGEPISRAAELLRETGLVDEKTNVFVRIDQYEELPTLDFSGSDFGILCQQIIHKALSSRSSRVSYRIGTRQYAWPDRPQIFATSGALELQRDFSFVNIDDKLRRSENQKTWLFPDLVEDVFARRLALTKYKFYAKSDSLLQNVFGKSLSAVPKAKMLVASEKSRKSMLVFESNWPVGWNSFLEKLAANSPLSAKLGEAWVRQKDKRKKDVVYHPPEAPPFPWDKTYWKKERSEQALTQIASRNKQQLIWQGKNDIVGLSGGNILVFLFLCQHVWDAWLRETRHADIVMRKKLEHFSTEVQSLGILNASEEWQKKPIEGKMSKIRSLFIQRMGERYYNLLTNDLAMSYPGRSGFSISNSDIENDKYVCDYLKVAVDYGDLYEAPHTSKIKGEKRTKFYLAPILCPSFGFTYKHTKEPEYLRAAALYEFLSENSAASKHRKNAQHNRNTDFQQKFKFDSE